MQPVFIVGEQRSGSNLLRLMLNQMSGVCAPHPPHILQRLTPLLPLIDSLGDQKNWLVTQAVCDLVENNPIPWNSSPMNRDVIYRLGGRHGLIGAFAAAMQTEASQRIAHTWVCKSMQNIRSRGELDAYFHRNPPKYIFLHRDPRDVCLSFQKAIVGEKEPYSIARRWNELQQLCLKSEREIPDRTMRIGYEELANSPDQTMKHICEFLDLPFDPKFSQFHLSDEAQTAARSAQQWSRLASPITKQRLGRYKEELKVEDTLTIERVCFHSMLALGYLPEHFSEKSPPSFYSQNEIVDFESRNDTLKRDFLNFVGPREKEQELNQRRLTDEISRRWRSLASRSQAGMAFSSESI